MLDFELNTEDYLALKGSRCPSCGTLDIVGGQLQADGDEVTQEISCSKCFCTWTDVYKLIGFDDLIRPTGRVIKVGKDG